MKPLKLFIPALAAAGVFLVLLAVGGVILVPRAWNWYQDLRHPVSPKPAVGSAVWSAPAGSVGTTMPGETDIGAHEPPMSRQEADTKLRNPLAGSPQVIESGKKLFASYCTACHGPEGKGDGPVAGKAQFPPPNLQISASRRSDGFLYATIRNGGAVMPSLGHALAPLERWQIVHFLRSISVAAPLPAAPAVITGTPPDGPLTSAPPAAVRSDTQAASGDAEVAREDTEVARGNAQRGKSVFDVNCSACHAADSDEEIVGPGLQNLFNWPAHRGADGSEHSRHTVPLIRKQIVDGGGAMAPMGEEVSGQDLEDLLAYLQTL